MISPRPFHKCRCGLMHVAAKQHNLHMFDCFCIHQTFASAIILRSIFLQTLVHRPISSIFNPFLAASLVKQSVFAALNDVSGRLPELSLLLFLNLCLEARRARLTGALMTSFCLNAWTCMQNKSQKCVAQCLATSAQCTATACLKCWSPFTGAQQCYKFINVSPTQTVCHSQCILHAEYCKVYLSCWFIYAYIEMQMRIIIFHTMWRQKQGQLSPFSWIGFAMLIAILVSYLASQDWFSPMPRCCAYRFKMS